MLLRNTGRVVAQPVPPARGIVNNQSDTGLKSFLDEHSAANSISETAWKAKPNYDPDKVHKFIVDCYNEYLADGGVPIDFAKALETVDSPIINGEKKIRLGRLDPKNRTLSLFKGANNATFVEELLHYIQAKMFGIWGKEGFGKERKELAERAVEETLKYWDLFQQKVYRLSLIKSKHKEKIKWLLTMNSKF